MTSHDDLVAAHNTVAARISADSAAALRRIIDKIDNDEAQYDGFGTRIYDYE